MRASERHDQLVLLTFRTFVVMDLTYPNPTNFDFSETQLLVRFVLLFLQCTYYEVGSRVTHFSTAMAAGLDALMGRLWTVEEAHLIFKPWLYLGGGPIRGLDAADAGRIIARYGHLEPETRPLLARGAPRGAAILLDGQPSSKSIGQLDLEYGEETARAALEE